MKNYFIGFSAVLFAAAVILSGCKNPSANTGAGGNTPGGGGGDTGGSPFLSRIDAGKDFSLAVDETGRLFSWGDNSKGQLGDNALGSDSKHPARIGSDSNWAGVSAGESHTLAVKKDGTLWAWGNHADGRLGVGVVTADRKAPVQVGGAAHWIPASAGSRYSLAVDNNGGLWAWGLNDSGQLGYTATDTLRTLREVTFRGRKIPGQVGTDSDWDKIYAGFDYSLAIRTDGTLWAWGGNSSGQLGFGTPLDGTGELTSQTTPRQAGRSANWADISTAAPDGDNGGTKPVSHTLAIDTEGRLYSWGSSGSRELGRGAASGYLRPGEITLE